MLMSGRQVVIHPSSVLCGKKPSCIVFNDMIWTTRQYARGISVIEPAWLAEHAPAFYTAHSSAGS